jgi:transposase
MVAEIISTVERRRHWPDDEKLRILSEALLPDATVAAVADRNGVCRSLLYTWLRLARQGKLPGISMTRQPVSGFVPVRIDPPIEAPSPSLTLPGSQATGDPHMPISPRAPARGRRPALVEIALTNGRVIKVDECIDPAALAQLVAALDGGRS